MVLRDLDNIGGGPKSGLGLRSDGVVKVDTVGKPLRHGKMGSGQERKDGNEQWVNNG